MDALLPITAREKNNQMQKNTYNLGIFIWSDGIAQFVSQVHFFAVFRIQIWIGSVCDGFLDPGS